ncbi:tryptophan 2,3-dioxygenase [Microbacterium elymi]|uniref:Tryptophan 2,3-dioxygenase n=1 Tax=Microbacterium elymi TaxID=2909587 RepID=A0ABY5NH28_9MICO|nr:tryptophan 2,3-dioxygenase family protein [Microbacterium elymi]UUT34475.1 tryptophan 2,3-dioxygenase family protein [Microbacterium elymi]
MDDGVERNTRTIEESVITDFEDRMTYSGYLQAGHPAQAQHPLSSPEHHDELLFIIQHQTTELWLRLILHELGAACRLLREDELAPALKCIARVKHIQKTITDQWSVLATLTPSEYAQFRGVLGNASGFQSAQYRAVEFTLGNKHAGMLKVFAADPENLALVEAALRAPSLYDEFLRLLARAGHAVPAAVLERDVTKAWEYTPELVPVFAEIYADPAAHWGAYETCEELVDLEDNFQLWRFRHLKTVERIIGHKRGTGGSSGVGFLKRALDLTFFPELYAVRTEIGA